MNTDVAETITGGLSNTSKMPCPSYGLSPRDCKMGQKLRKCKNSICSKCYARRGYYVFDAHKKSSKLRLKGLEHPQWVEAMTALINNRSMSYFRWFDSGDIQSLDHLKMIMEVIHNTPKTKHWLVTKEYGMIADYLKETKAPKNVCIRLSAYYFDKVSHATLAKKLHVQICSASKKGEHNCKAAEQNGECLLCRDCWDKSIFNISYKYH